MLLPIASLLIFIGTYTPPKGESKGVYSLQFNPTTGALSTPVLAAKLSNPTFLALHPNGRVIYALSESDTVRGKPGGGATAFNIDVQTGQLELLNRQPSGGVGGAHLGLDPDATTLLLASYSGGQVTSFPLAKDGQIKPPAGTQMLTGILGPQQDRQDKPHPHSVTVSPDGRFAYLCDLGLDKVFCYELKAATMTPAGDFATAAGAGPRHSKFSADGRFFYVINELNSTITTFTCAPATGKLSDPRTVSTLPKNFSGENTCAEIRLHPNERFVYGSNRGHDSLAVFAREPRDGSLQLIEIVPSGGAHPRNFALSPDGAWLICANRDSNNLVVFKVNPETGRLTATGQTATVPMAVCVLFTSID
jgi:6-phosphogluconolactonase